LSEAETLEKVKSTIIFGDRGGAWKAAEEVVKKGVDIQEAVDSMAEAMKVVGTKFENHEYFTPDLIMAGQAMKRALEVLSPHLKKFNVKYPGKIVIGSVAGDLHDIGKNLVTSMFQGAGFNVYDLGVDVTAANFSEKAREVGAEIVAASAYMATTTPELKNVGDALEKAGIRGKVKFLIGGAAVGQKHVEWAGADAYAPSALEAVKMAEKLVGKE